MTTDDDLESYFAHIKSLLGQIDEKLSDNQRERLTRVVAQGRTLRPETYELTERLLRNLREVDSASFPPSDLEQLNALVDAHFEKWWDLYTRGPS